MNGAKIAYYHKGQLFETTCANTDGHGRCRLTRTARAAQGRQQLANPLQGRPLGLCVAWALKCDQASRGEHLRWRPSADERQAARQVLLDSDSSKAAELLRGERPLALGESMEPAVID